MSESCKMSQFVLIDMVDYLSRVKEHDLRKGDPPLPTVEATKLIDQLHQLEHEPGNADKWAEVAMTALAVLMRGEEQPADAAIRMVSVLAKRERALRLERHGASCETSIL